MVAPTPGPGNGIIVAWVFLAPYPLSSPKPINSTRFAAPVF